MSVAREEVTVALEEIVDTVRYPLHEPAGERWREIVADVRRDLDADGCCVLRDVIAEPMRARLRAEGAAVAPRAYTTVRTVNVYNTEPDPAAAPDHPGRRTFERGNAFVARDLIPADALIQRLYVDGTFQRFVAECFRLPRLYPLADPLSGLCLNVVVPGRDHPWHFDTNEFTVSMLTQAPDGGGAFEYCPDIRSADAENPDDVGAVLDGRRAGTVLTLRPGDLQLFRGRYSLHRVRPVEGATERHSAIFAYSEVPGVVGTPVRTRQLFGRSLPVHEAGARVDGLLV